MKEIKTMRKYLAVLIIGMLMMTTMATMALAVDNLPPAKPSLEGPASGKRYISYQFNATTTDPEGEYIAYNFSWGEGNNTGWIMPYAESGAIVTAQYAWIKLGMYNVTVKAKDVWGHESIVSDPLMITITNDPPAKPVITGQVYGILGTP